MSFLKRLTNEFKDVRPEKVIKILMDHRNFGLLKDIRNSIKIDSEFKDEDLIPRFGFTAYGLHIPNMVHWYTPGIFDKITFVKKYLTYLSLEEITELESLESHDDIYKFVESHAPKAFVEKYSDFAKTRFPYIGITYHLVQSIPLYKISGSEFIEINAMKRRIITHDIRKRKFPSFNKE